MVNIERVVCPTDLSTEADEALRYALALTIAYEAKLILLYCKQRGSVPEWASGTRALSLFRQSLSNRLNAHELRALDWTGVVCDGDNVALAITNEAQNRKADLIVMRSRRRPHAALWLGSTAEMVCRTAPCPVLVTHPDQAEWVGSSTAEIDLRRVLVAHDFSRDSELALNYGCRLAEEYEAELHLLHVLGTHDSAEPELAWTGRIDTTSDKTVAQKLEEAIPKEAWLWCKTVSSVCRGRTYKEILRYAKEHEIDLICIGASGNDWALEKVLGSTVDHVLRNAPCPVFVARPLMHASSLTAHIA